MAVPPQVLIAGAGVAGLRCATALADAGIAVTVVEAGPRLGGRASSWTDDTTGDAVDIGPHVVSTEHRNFLAWLQRLGTAQHLLWQPRPLLTLLDHGHVLRMQVPAWPVPLHGLPALPDALRRVSVADALSNARLAWQAARMTEADTLALDGEDAASLLRRLGVRPRFVDWFWRSAMLALLNVPLEQCSAAAALRVFRLMLGRSGYHFAFPTVGLGELFTGASVALIEAAGGRVIVGSGVHELLVQGGRFEGFVLADGRRLHAAHGVLALPPAAMAHLGRHGQGLALEHLATTAEAFAPSPYVSSMLWFDRPITSERFWARTWHPEDLNTDFYDLSNIRTPGQGRPALVACNAIHAHRAWEWDDARIVARCREEIAQFAPAARDAQLRHARVHRVPIAIPCPAPGTERLRPPNVTPVQGLWLAGDWTATALPCSMESAARSGALAAEAVGHATGHTLRVSLPAPETTGLVARLRRR